MAIGKLKTVVLDAPDIARLSAFYSELAGVLQKYADHEWMKTMTTGDGWRIGLQSAPDHVPPQWPERHPTFAAGPPRPARTGSGRGYPEGGRTGPAASAGERALEHPHRPHRPPASKS